MLRCVMIQYASAAFSFSTLYSKSIIKLPLLWKHRPGASDEGSCGAAIQRSSLAAIRLFQTVSSRTLT